PPGRSAGGDSPRPHRCRTEAGRAALLHPGQGRAASRPREAERRPRTYGPRAVGLMPVRLVAGAEGEAAWQALVEADRALFRIPAHESDARFLRGDCKWVVDQMRIMRSLIALHHVDELIVTPLCAVLQAAGSG